MKKNEMLHDYKKVVKNWLKGAGVKIYIKDIKNVEKNARDYAYGIHHKINYIVTMKNGDKFQLFLETLDGFKYSKTSARFVLVNLIDVNKYNEYKKIVLEYIKNNLDIIDEIKACNFSGVDHLQEYIFNYVDIYTETDTETDTLNKVIYDILDTDEIKTAFQEFYNNGGVVYGYYN